MRKDVWWIKCVRFPLQPSQLGTCNITVGQLLSCCHDATPRVLPSGLPHLSVVGSGPMWMPG